MLFRSGRLQTATLWHSGGQEDTQRYLSNCPSTSECVEKPTGRGRIYDAALGRLAQQSAEGDDGRHAGAVEEEERGHTLKATGVCVVRQVVGKLPLDVQKQSTEPPDNTHRKTFATRAASVHGLLICNVKGEIIPVWATRSSGVAGQQAVPHKPGQGTRLTQDTHTHTHH